VFGALNTLAGTALVRTIGAGGVTAALITRQLLASVLLDRVGALGLDRRPIDGARIAGGGPARPRHLPDRRLTEAPHR
jgi:uncharacterized membrane protein YdcZ (DUF606 family)